MSRGFLSKAFITVGAFIVTAIALPYFENIETVSSWIYGHLRLLALVGVLGISLLFFGYFIIKPRTIIQTKIQPLSPYKAKSYQRCVLIALVSKFRWPPRAKDAQNPKAAPQAEQPSLEDFISYIKEGDCARFEKHIPQTNLGPLVKAIKEQPSLKEVWLIPSTESYEEAKLIRDYLVRCKQLKNDAIHLSKDFTIHHAMESDALEEASNKVQKAYQAALARNRKPCQIMTDVTGGTKAMTVGAILGSLHHNQDVQYSAVQNDDGTLETFRYHFWPKVEEQDSAAE